jgi:CxxC motif-containing protein (DUF1111 family)
MFTRDSIDRCCAVAFILAVSVFAAQAAPVTDPGVRHAASDGASPAPLPGLTADELAFFQDGLARFSAVKVVASASGDNSGLGPRFNSNSCGSCHVQPVIGGTSPPVNPLMGPTGVASAAGATNSVPWFIVPNGPIREARFIASNGVPDGGVHDLFVVTGRNDVASDCNISQPSFTPAGDGLTGRGGNPNVVYRIPTPLLGAGLIEAIPDSAILANMRTNAAGKRQDGVIGHPNAHLSGTMNRSANDGTITRFGWKAQNKSLLMFAGEAYNVEMGISNLLFPQERDETAACQGPNLTPNDTATFASTTGVGTMSDMEAFADFMRMLAPPTPAQPTASALHGRTLFSSVGCALCHTPTLTTGAAVADGNENTASAALSNQPVNLFSDLLVHRMGTRLADGITQGAAGPDEFRTAPLWGVGQRVFFLHDGRTNNLVIAIREHASPGSEATQVVERFFALDPQSQQDLINFLRSL